MKLLTLKNHKLEINVDALANPVFAKLWEQDPSPEKHKAYKELLAIYYICDFSSPYSKYPEAERISKVYTDVFTPAYKPSKEMQKVMQEYKDIQYQNSPSLRLLNAAREAVHKLADWLGSVDYSKDADKSVKEVTDAISKIGKMIESLNQLEEAVKKEITSSSRAKGGGSKGLYED